MTSIKFIAVGEKEEKIINRVQMLFSEIGYRLIDSDKSIYVEINDRLDEEFNFLQDDSLKLVAKNECILFRSMVQLLIHSLLGEGLKVSSPNVNERCLMLDIGRKYYSLPILKSLVQVMALFNFTHLQLHFSENEGFRIESKKYPKIVSNHFLRQSEIKELIDYAQKYYIEIIPDIDSPGHLAKVLQNYPEYQLMKLQENQLVRDKTALDILNPEAVEFVFSIYQEYANLFKQSKYFHIGADEFIDFDKLEDYPTLVKEAQSKFGDKASGIELFILYVNELIQKMNNLGFIVRVWNDGFYRLNREEKISLTSDCQISYWTKWNKNMAPIEKYLSLGYEVINHNDNYLYYVLGNNSSYTLPTYEKIQENFETLTFANNQNIEKDNKNQVIGVALSVWADEPNKQSCQEICESLFYLLAAMNEKVSGYKLSKRCYLPLFNSWKKYVLGEITS